MDTIRYNCVSLCMTIFIYIYLFLTLICMQIAFRRPFLVFSIYISCATLERDVQPLLQPQWISSLLHYLQVFEASARDVQYVPNVSQFSSGLVEHSVWDQQWPSLYMLLSSSVAKSILCWCMFSMLGDFLRITFHVICLVLWIGSAI